VSDGCAEVRVVRDAAAVHEVVASAIGARAREAIDARGWFTLALAGGRTPRGVYALLADEPRLRDAIDWARVHAFFGDERCVPPDHPESNYGMARAALLSKVPIPAAQVHRMRGELPPAEAAAAYEAELRALAAAPGSAPRLDLVLLGIGEDGHVASLFPGTPAFDERTRLVVPNHVPHLGAWRITVTFPVLEAAAAVLFLADGERKAKAVAAALAPDGATSDRLPARRVKPASGSVTWIVDRAAAGE
jgi:6-phosphogluconolactonase